MQVSGSITSSALGSPPTTMNSISAAELHCTAAVKAYTSLGGSSVNSAEQWQPPYMSIASHVHNVVTVVRSSATFITGTMPALCIGVAPMGIMPDAMMCTVSPSLGATWFRRCTVTKLSSPVPTMSKTARLSVPDARHHRAASTIASCSSSFTRVITDMSKRGPAEHTSSSQADGHMMRTSSLYPRPCSSTTMSTTSPSRFTTQWPSSPSPTPSMTMKSPLSNTPCDSTTSISSTKPNSSHGECPSVHDPSSTIRCAQCSSASHASIRVDRPSHRPSVKCSIVPSGLSPSGIPRSMMRWSRRRQCSEKENPSCGRSAAKTAELSSMGSSAVSGVSLPSSPSTVMTEPRFRLSSADGRKTMSIWLSSIGAMELVVMELVTNDDGLTRSG
mmetsp:Transcript_36103/g.72415  ORF Transcript_36103/g.72415 Transcript_36103/m.72415 type:complete len:388 (-) Transcript_36103:5772-6935(-)